MTPKQQRFKDEYLIDLNATQAAIRAGYSEKTAYSQGQRLLKNAEVCAAIDAARAELSEKTAVTLESLTEMLKASYEVAKKQDNGSAMTQATMGMAKLHGLEVDPRKNQRRPLEDVSEDDLDRGIERLAAEAGFGSSFGREGDQTTH